MAPTRKKPFSGKAKKQQLQEKRERNRARAAQDAEDDERDGFDADAAAPAPAPPPPPPPPPAPTQPIPRRGDLRTIFQVEPRAAVEARKRDAPRPLAYAPDRGDSQSIYAAFGVHAPANQPRIFVKPRWSREMTPEALREVEDAAYAEWLAAVEQEARGRSDGAALNLFERNMEVWRELWRVLERSRVLVHLADARCPLLHVSDRLLAHVATLQPRKMAVLVLTKTDLVSADRVRAWTEYLHARYKLQVVAYNRDDVAGSNVALLRAVGRAAAELDRVERRGEEAELTPLTFGLVGEPNVGKSSLLNNLFGRKLVSVSATPGHTKHWQTHFLDGAEELLLPESGGDGAPRRRILVCDCPGVVFPRVGVPPALQILFGSFPIAQTREPFSAIRFLAENCAPPLHEAYRLRPVDADEPDADWSPYSLCEAYAQLRGFRVKGGRPDVNRAANTLLRDALGGKKLALAFPPPTAGFNVDR